MAERTRHPYPAEPWVSETALVAAVADVLEQWASREDPDIARVVFNQQWEDMAMRVLAALADGGRLVSPGEVETTVEWASEHRDHGREGLPDPLVAPWGWNRAIAERTVADWQRRGRGTHRLVRREVTIVTGPWQPAESTEERGDA